MNNIQVQTFFPTQYFGYQILFLPFLDCSCVLWGFGVKMRVKSEDTVLQEPLLIGNASEINGIVSNKPNGSETISFIFQDTKQKQKGE